MSIANPTTKINKITYATKYNPHFRPISNQQITTVEISPTGSGKTHFYKNSPNTIMLMPTNALVRQHNGLIAKDKASPTERFQWDDRHTNKCDYMTYDKFLGHSHYENMSDINVIIDEAHLILASLSDTHYSLLEKLFTRSFKYKELKLISATLRHEILKIYDYRANEPMQINQYINTNFSPSIQFTKTLPIIDTSVKTLFFINSNDKMIQVQKIYERKCPGIKVVLLSADKPIPSDTQLAKYDLILSTCVLKQGYSINSKIDQVIIHNVYNAVGSMDIIQYMARPRVGQPKIYVIPSSVHFITESSDLNNLPQVSAMLHHVVQTGKLTSTQYKTNSALVMDKFLAQAKTTRSGWNILGVTEFYERLLKYHELHLKGGISMIKSIQNIIPSAKITIKDIPSGYDLNFTILKLTDEHVKLLEESKDIAELTDNIKIIIKSTTEPRLLKKMDQYLKITNNLVKEFNYTPKGEPLPKLYHFQDACLVRQVLDDKVRGQCKQHVKNIEKNAYDYRDTNLRYAPNLGDVILVSKLGRKLKFLRSYFNGMRDDIELLSKLYCFKRYNEKGDEITARSRDTIYTVEITDMFCVETDWYFKTGMFLYVEKD